MSSSREFAVVEVVGVVPPPALVSQSLLRSPWAPVLPPLAGVSFLMLAELTHALAVTHGHCDVMVNGTAERVSIPAISPATRLPPERWIWTVGVVATCILLLFPSLLLIWEVLRRSASRACCCGTPHAAQCILMFAAVGLLGLACVPLQADILSDDACLGAQSLVHLTFAA